MKPDILLTETKVEELSLFFEFQLEEEARYLAAFTPAVPLDKAAYLQKHTLFLSNPDIHNRTISYKGKIVGSIAKFMMEGEAEITYWIDKKYWGRGIAGEALRMFLQLEKTRPIYGRVAFDNYGSQKVLEKGGFEKIGTDRGFANARGEEIEEFIYRLK